MRACRLSDGVSGLHFSSCPELPSWDGEACLPVHISDRVTVAHGAQVDHACQTMLIAGLELKKTHLSDVKGQGPAVATSYVAANVAECVSACSHLHDLVRSRAAATTQHAAPSMQH